MTNPNVPFNDLSLGDAGLAADIDEAIRRVLDSSWFVLGPEVEAFEKELARAVSSAHGIGVASGTDALSLSLMALGVGAGDEVVTSPLTATFTAIAISRIGATPVFADVDEETLMLSPTSVERRLTRRTRAIVPVHLYGNAVDMDAMLDLAKSENLVVVEDACQAHGARYRGKSLGSLGHAGAFSFYPTKNLGALGDGGFITTEDEELAARLRQLRNGGQESRYIHASIGLNSRLDELQAAVLRAKLPHLERWNQRRRAIAALYEEGLAGHEVRTVELLDDTESARHLFVVRTSGRDALMDGLKDRGVSTLVHYPVPAHLQPGYAHLEQPAGSCPVAEKAAESILSLPLYPSMHDDDARYVIECIAECS